MIEFAYVVYDVPSTLVKVKSIEHDERRRGINPTTPRMQFYPTITEYPQIEPQKQPATLSTPSLESNESRSGDKICFLEFAKEYRSTLATREHSSPDTNDLLRLTTASHFMPRLTPESLSTSAGKEDEVTSSEEAAAAANDRLHFKKGN
jgi:hypothetical protein